MNLVLDTNIYCDFAEGIPGIVDILIANRNGLYLPVIVLAELTLGFKKGSRQTENETKLQEVIDTLGIEIIQISTDIARKYAHIYLELQKKGRKIPINDVWIAACCMEIGGTLLSRDSHFEAVDSIELYPLKAAF
jgi:tRNA(fMet)-specific endonuclease VapC